MATKIVSTTGGNWNAAATWSPSGVPATTDDIRFSSTSSFLNVNVASTCATIDFTNYTNAITMSAALTVNGNVTFIAGLKVGGTNQLTIGAASTLTSNGFEWPNTLNIGTGTFTVTLSGNARVSGSLTIAAAGAATMNSNTIFVSGGLTAGRSISGTSTIQLVGTGTWSGAGTVTNALTVNTTGTITLSGTVLKGTGNLTWTAGSLSAAGSTLSLAGTTVAASAVTWNNVTLAGGTATLSENLNVGGSLAVNTSNTVNGLFTVDIAGNYALNTGNLAGTSTIRLSGTGTITQGLNYQTQIAMVLSGSGDYELRQSPAANETRALFKTNNLLTYQRGTLSGTGSIQIGAAGGTPVTMSIESPMLFDRLIVANPINWFSGSSGFHVNHFTASAAGSRIIFQSGSRYSVTSSLQVLGTAASNVIFTSSLANSSSIFTLVQGAVQDVEYVTATDINSGEGQTIWDFGGTLTRTVNWNLLTAPQGVAYTWVS